MRRHAPRSSQGSQLAGRWLHKQGRRQTRIDAAACRLSAGAMPAVQHQVQSVTSEVVVMVALYAMWCSCACYPARIVLGLALRLNLLSRHAQSVLSGDELGLEPLHLHAQYRRSSPLNVCSLCVHRGPAVSLPSQQLVGVEDSGLPPHGWGSPRTWLRNFISSTISTYVGRCPSHEGLSPSCMPIEHDRWLEVRLQLTSVKCGAFDRNFDVTRRVSAESPFQKSKLGFERRLRS